MNISTLLDHIDSGHMALPEFQRGYVWNRDQVRGLMDSLYKRHPVGSLLVWATKSETAQHRGDGQLAAGVIKLLLDGQQRITSLYGIIRGHAPEFFDGNANSFTNLYFHLDREEFAFYSPIKMADDPLWVDVSDLMKSGNDGLGQLAARLGAMPELAPKIGDYVGRLSRVLGIKDINLHVEEVTGPDKTIDVVVDIFNRVNSGGTKLSKGDLALAKICAEWPEARDRMKAALKKWYQAGFDFNLDWLLRNINTIVTGEAKFNYLHHVESERIQRGLERAEKAIDYTLNLIGGRLGLDHDRVLFSRYALPVMTRYIDQRGGQLADAIEQDKLLFWFLQSAMWGRFSGSTESMIDKALEQIEELEGGLDRLIEELRLWHGGQHVEPGHFGGWSLGARFYPMLYMLTRVGEAKDWGTGLPLKAHLLGRMSKLEVHHIFPKSQLYKHKYRKSQVNAVANFCFLTKDANLKISNRRPIEYFPTIEDAHPGVLASQWIPMDPELWKLDNYLDFLKARRKLLADAANSFLRELLHNENFTSSPTPAAVEKVETASASEVTAPAIKVTAAVSLTETTAEASSSPLRGEASSEAKQGAASGVSEDDIAAMMIPGSVDSAEEEQTLLELREWVIEQGLPEGSYMYELSHPETGVPLAVLDLAWPNGG